MKSSQLDRLKSLFAHIQSGPLRDPEKAEKRRQLNTEYQQLADHLKSLFSTDVSVRINDKGKGKIVIQFNSNDEMEHVLGMLDRLNT
jgi:ParB family transcriptional regulator, chromosome partitioning protein